MPTGYTAEVGSGETTDLATWAMVCARGMGALVTMRDCDANAPIPEFFEPSDYNQKRVAEIDEKLAALRAMSPEEREAASQADYRERVASAERYMVEREQQRTNYLAMRAKVVAWTGEPEGIKKFMLSQLDESIAFDCPPNRVYYGSTDPQTPDEWYAEQEAKLIKERAYHVKGDQEERERTAARNLWLAQLRASLAALVPENAKERG
jgi:hypothetical protein